MRRWVHDIDTGNAKPIRAQGRPLSPPENEAVRKFIEEGLRDGVIEPSESPWSAPLILVKKKDGSTSAY
ncbi:hypothetical protein NEOLEDRAFT_1131307 [Neolentinus lepideus HHB14362 ss-1]|uniref:DNA/RNA polymerase n=1 Tax=Neolentinus lepideus HHB14362 ss-1 TaxID=1314782 RepID=A0A165TVX9_9AGAM|nr:hypothetical protein NEOLEDRAFT_1131307 [Neolentinus lepideus HHB14362 ss-1]